MNASGLTLNVHNFRAIESAKIALDEITVLTGVNACGKSTIAHLFHSLVNLNAVYPVSLIRYSWSMLEPIVFAVNDFRWQIDHPGQVRPMLSRYEGKPFADQLFNRPFGELISDFDSYQQTALRDYGAMGTTTDNQRLYAAFVREIGCSVGAAESSLPSPTDVSAWISKKVADCRAFYSSALEKRNYAAFVSGDAKARDLLMDTGDISLSEGGSEVYSTSSADSQSKVSVKTPLAPIYGVTRALYIESPWLSMPEQRSDGRLSFTDGFPPVAVRPNGTENLFGVLSGQLDAVKRPDEYHWSALAGESPFQWVYKRDDGGSFPLRECATGIRSLAILNVLYTRGVLDSKTLLVIDEPEAHLHPQWIVSYANIVVALVKKLKVRVLITTHSPYMIRALRGAAGRELSESKIAFYLAEPAGEYRYTYRSVGTDIAPIFKVFNVALDEIATYREQG